MFHFGQLILAESWLLKLQFATMGCPLVTFQKKSREQSTPEKCMAVCSMTGWCVTYRYHLYHFRVKIWLNVRPVTVRSLLYFLVFRGEQRCTIRGWGRRSFWNGNNWPSCWCLAFRCQVALEGLISSITGNKPLVKLYKVLCLKCIVACHNTDVSNQNIYLYEAIANKEQFILKTRYTTTWKF